MHSIEVILTEWPGSPVIRDIVDKPYRRIPAQEFRYKSTKLTERQQIFHQNLVAISKAIGSNKIPVDFILKKRGRVFLDRGCIKMAEHIGFIAALSNSDTGVVDYIYLSSQ